MITLQAIDETLFTALNGVHTPYCDVLMRILTGNMSWTIITLAMVFVLYKKGWRQLALGVLCIALVVLLSDQVSTLIKHSVMRLRPSHNPALEGTIQLVNGYRGGMYGFVSSHAANSFGVMALLCLMFRNRRVTVSLTIWTLLVCYSRIYMGVHYPGDILCGGMLGAMFGCLVYCLWRAVLMKQHINARDVFIKADGNLIAWSVVANVMIMTLVALFVYFLKK